MGCVKAGIRLKVSWLHSLLQLVLWLYSFRNTLAKETTLEQSHISTESVLASPPKSGIFEPIEVLPAIVPNYSFPVGSLPPMYPTYPATYDPVLTGRCPVNFSVISSIVEKTASDCNQPLAPVVANVICCPQFSSLLHIFQGFYSTNTDNLALQIASADDCFKDIVSILASRGANSSLPAICSVKSSNLTGGSCPVKDVTTFEKTVNTSKLLEACSSVDPLKECCRAICQPAIMEAVLKISGTQSLLDDNKNANGGLSSNFDALNDCKGVVYSWLSRNLPHDSANTVFRILSACKVNKVCPLDFKQPTEVINACRNIAAPNPSCCNSLNTYIAGVQRLLITNRQAIICASTFGSILQKGGVMTNVYELCDVDLKDFSLQVAAYGQHGCLLRSLPVDMVYDNITGFSFTCDLSDNIEAPWPSSSSVTTMSLCAPEMSLPALPTSRNSGDTGCRGRVMDLFVLILSIFVLDILLLL